MRRRDLRMADALMGADDPTGGFDGSVHGMCVTYSLANPGEAKRVFDALSEIPVEED